MESNIELNDELRQFKKQIELKLRLINWDFLERANICIMSKKLGVDGFHITFSYLHNPNRTIQGFDKDLFLEKAFAFLGLNQIAEDVEGYPDTKRIIIPYSDFDPAWMGEIDYDSVNFL